MDRFITKNNGTVSFKKGVTITPIPNCDGYLQCKLCKNGKSRTVRIHRIVAETFIGNPKNLLEVNHIDCDRRNNYVNNLEWVSHIDNVSHSTKLGHYRKPSGEQNPNFGNTKLKEYFATHAEEKMKLSRKGEQNGRARKISVLINDNKLQFGYIGSCADYLLKNNIVNNIKYDSLCTRITERIKTGKPYQGLTFFEI